MREKLKKALPMALFCAALLVLALSLTEPGKACWRSLFTASGFVPDTGAPLNIHVLDVGKADAILIQCEGHAALLDAGYYPNGEAVVNYLSRCGVERLDYVIASHPDKDHIGGMETVLGHVETSAFVRSRYFAEEYSQLEGILEEKDIPLKTAAPGDVLEFGGAKLEIVGPVKEYEDTNNTSLVFRLSYRGFTALFCGDVEDEAEKDLVKSGRELRADLLKVPHHGSKTSCSKRFLKAVKPKYAVIPTGRDNNDLPDEKTIERLHRAGVQELYETDIDGTVVFSFDGNHITVQTQAE